MVLSLKARLEKERMTLIKLDRFMNESGPSTAQNPLVSDMKPADAMRNQMRRDSIANSQRNDVDMMRSKNEKSKMHPFDSEMAHERGSNMNSLITNDPNFKRSQIGTMRQMGSAVSSQNLSAKIPRGGKTKATELHNEVEESKGFARNFPTPSGSLLQDDSLLRQTPTDSQRELKSLPFVMNTHPRVLEIQKKEAGRNTPLPNQRFSDINNKSINNKDKDTDIDSKKYNLRHKIEEGGNSEIKLRKMVNGNPIPLVAFLYKLTVLTNK